MLCLVKGHTSSRCAFLTHIQATHAKTSIQPANYLLKPATSQAFFLLREIKCGSRRRHLDDSRSVQDHRIGNRPISLGFRDENIRLAHRRSGDDRLDHITRHCRHNRRGGQPAHEDDEERRRQRALDAEGECDTLRSGNALRGGQGGEGHDGQRGVGCGAGSDEGGGEGVDGVEAKGGAVGVRGRDLAEVEALDRGVQGLSDEDGARNAEVGLTGDEAGAAEVGGCADAFEHGGEGDEGFWVGVGEAVGAGCDWFGARSGKGRGEELDVLFFVVGDVF